MLMGGPNFDAPPSTISFPSSDATEACISSVKGMCSIGFHTGKLAGGLGGDGGLRGLGGLGGLGGAVGPVGIVLLQVPLPTQTG